jgi:hypothetical protein
MIKFALVTNADYYNDTIPKMYLFNTKEEAYAKLFGKEIPEWSKARTIKGYWKSCVKRFDNGDGNEIHLLFKINTETNKSELILGQLKDD